MDVGVEIFVKKKRKKRENEFYVRQNSYRFRCYDNSLSFFVPEFEFIIIWEKLNDKIQRTIIETNISLYESQRLDSYLRHSPSPLQTRTFPDRWSNG